MFDFVFPKSRYNEKVKVTNKNSLDTIIVVQRKRWLIKRSD